MDYDVIRDCLAIMSDRAHAAFRYATHIHKPRTTIATFVHVILVTTLWDWNKASDDLYLGKTLDSKIFHATLTIKSNID